MDRNFWSLLFCGVRIRIALMTSKHISHITSCGMVSQVHLSLSWIWWGAWCNCGGAPGLPKVSANHLSIPRSWEQCSTLTFWPDTGILMGPNEAGTTGLMEGGAPWRGNHHHQGHLVVLPSQAHLLPHVGWREMGSVGVAWDQLLNSSSTTSLQVEFVQWGKELVQLD